MHLAIVYNLKDICAFLFASLNIVSFPKLGICLFVLSFFPRGVLDDILNLIESVSEGFPSYYSHFKGKKSYSRNLVFSR